MKPPSTKQQRLACRWLALEYARVIAVALRQLADEVGALAAYRHLDACRRDARAADDPGLELGRLLVDAVKRAERGVEFPDGKPWRRAA